AKDGIRYRNVTGVQTCALPISHSNSSIARLRLPDPTDRHGQEGYGQKGCKVSTMGDMKILTVCLGNICRSPAAESVLNREFTQPGIDAAATAAGTADGLVGAV